MPSSRAVARAQVSAGPSSGSAPAWMTSGPPSTFHFSGSTTSAGPRLVRTGVVPVDRSRPRAREGAGVAGLALDAGPPVEVISPHGSEYVWTRKLGGVRARGRVVLDGRERRIDARAVVDESAGYHARETAWEWSAGVGTTRDGRPLAWNLVDGIHDARRNSERSV